MKRAFLPAAAIVLALILACNKDKFATEPNLEYKSITPDVVVQGNYVVMRVRCRDKEGDLDSALTVQTRYDSLGAIMTVDTVRYGFDELSDLPKKVKDATLQLTWVYALQGGGTGFAQISAASDRDTELRVGLIVIDKAGHRSNYVESKKILLKKV